MTVHPSGMRGSCHEGEGEKRPRYRQTEEVFNRYLGECQGRIGSDGSPVNGEGEARGDPGDLTGCHDPGEDDAEIHDGRSKAGPGVERSLRRHDLPAVSAPEPPHRHVHRPLLPVPDENCKASHFRVVTRYISATMGTGVETGEDAALYGEDS